MAEQAGSPPAPWPSRKLLTQLGLSSGMLGFALGIFVALSSWVSDLWFFDDVRPVPYLLGGIAMVAGIVIIARDRKYKIGFLVFATGAAAALVAVVLWYLLIALVAVGVVVGLVGS